MKHSFTKLFKRDKKTKRPRTYKNGSTCKVLEASTNTDINDLCIRNHYMRLAL